MALVLDAPVHAEDFALMSLENPARLDGHDGQRIEAIRHRSQRRVVQLDFLLSGFTIITIDYSRAENK